MCWGVAGTHSETRLGHLPGHRARTGRPQTRGGRGEHLLSLPSPALASPGLQNKGPVAAAAPRSSYPAGPVQAPGRASLGPELKGAWFHTPPCPSATPPVPALFLQSERSSWKSWTCRQVSGWSRDPREGRGAVRDPRSRGDGPRPSLLCFPIWEALSFSSSVVGSLHSSPRHSPVARASLGSAGYRP